LYFKLRGKLGTSANAITENEGDAE
jgi:hypothetical protein